MTNRLVVENLKHRPVRTILSILAIGLEVTMMLTIVGISRGMIEDSQRRANGVGADIVVRPPGTSIISLSGAPMDEKFVPFLERQPHVKLVVGTMVQPLKGFSSVTGVDIRKFAEMSGGFRFLEGGPFRDPGDVLIGEYFARQEKVHAGDRVELLNRKWRVAGIFEEGKLARIVLPLPILQNLTSNTGKLSQIYLKVDDPANIPAVIDSLKSQLKDYPIYSMEELISLISVDNVPGLKAFRGVVVGISLVVGFLVVFLSMYTAVLERTREIGILKALGATPVYILGVLFRETLLLAVAGSLTGILLTYGSRWLIMTLVPAHLTQIIVFDWWPIASAIALAGALLGAAYPGWRAASHDPIEALSYE